jgi:hypothetical protein
MLRHQITLVVEHRILDGPSYPVVEIKAKVVIDLSTLPKM